MILYQNVGLEPVAAHERTSCLECMAEEHLLFCFSSIDALDGFLEQGLNELAALGYPRGLRRVVLIADDPRAIDSVGSRMLPGEDFIAWPQTAWGRLYQEIDTLRDRARRVNPEFLPRHVVQRIGGR